MSLPENPESRVEHYLSVLAEQEGAMKPENPQSRIEHYLDYLCENGSSKGSTPIPEAILGSGYTTAQAIAYIRANERKPIGKIFYGKPQWSDLPTGVTIADIRLLLYNTTDAVAEAWAESTSPYAWFYTQASNTWRPYGVDLTSGKYVVDITGDGTTTAFAITHNLNTRDLSIHVWEKLTYKDVIVDITRTSVNTTTITFGTAPANGVQYTFCAISTKGAKGDTGPAGDLSGVDINGTAVPTTSGRAQISLKTINNQSLTGSGNMSIQTLQPMKSAWCGSNLTTAQAASMILADSDVHVGDGFLGGVYWSDLSTLGLGNAEVQAYVITNGIIQFELTSSDTPPYAWFYNSASSTWRSYVPIVDAVNSTSTKSALSANMGKNLQDQVNNLKNIGRFLAIWNSTTGLPETNPVEMPYTYRTGDYYRVGTVSSATPAVNYKPNGATYTGTASTTVETEDVEVGWVYYYDGSQWVAQSAGGGGRVQDVQKNGVSVLDSGTGVANFTNATTSEAGLMSSADKSKLNGIEAGADVTDATNVDAAGAVMYTSQGKTDNQKTQARTNIGAAKAVQVIIDLD